MTAPPREVVVIGAGAAGIGAAKVLRQHRVPFRVLEASHRIGGRAHTEELAPGVAFDLGCHWLHSAGINPFTHVADAFGMRYRRRTPTFGVVDGRGRELTGAVEGFDALVESSMARMAEAVSAGRDGPVYDFIDRDSPYAAHMD